MAKVTEATQHQTFFAVTAVRKLRAGEVISPKSRTSNNFGPYLPLIDDMDETLKHAIGTAERDADVLKAMDTYWSAVRLDKRYRAIVEAVDALDIEEGAKPPPEEPTRHRALVTTMADVQSEPIDWLWWPYLAKGKLTMIDGDPGIGKTLLATAIAAALSRGWPLPDQEGRPTMPSGYPQASLLLSAEDGLADTLKPRLDKAGADSSKVHALTGWLDENDEVQVFTLQHMDILIEALERFRPGLVVIDPIQAYIGNIDLHRANETRPLMSSLKTAAERYHCVIACLRHPGKAQGTGKAIYRGLGSIDLIGAARTGLFAEQHPTDPDRALLAHHKSNIGPLGRTLQFSKADGCFQWAGVSRLSAEMLAGSGRGPDPHAFLAVVCHLEDRMKPGIPYPSKQLEEDLKEDGYGHEVVKRAKKALSIQSVQTAKGWTWTLPYLAARSPQITPPTDPTDATDTTDTTDTPDLESSTYDPVVGVEAVEAVGAEVSVAGMSRTDDGELLAPPLELLAGGANRAQAAPVLDLKAPVSGVSEVSADDTCQSCGKVFAKNQKQCFGCGQPRLPVAEGDAAQYERTCDHCGQSFVTKGRGRPPRFCSVSCRCKGWRAVRKET